MESHEQKIDEYVIKMCIKNNVYQKQKRRKFKRIYGIFYGGGWGTRTLDLCDVNAAL